MLTIERQKVQDYDSNGNPLYRILGFGLSTDPKPIDGVGNGSAIVEMDTSKVVFFDQEASTWREWGAEESASTLSASFAASPTVSPSIQPISLDRPGISPQVIEPEVEDEEPEAEQEAVSEDA